MKKAYVFVYTRKTGDLKVEECPTPEEAMQRRFALEKEVGPGVEVVTFYANSLEDIRKTHSRYFYSVPELLERISV